MSNPIIEPYNSNRIDLILEKALDEPNLMTTTKIIKDIEKLCIF